MKIAYLISEYPAISHTFIRREVEYLRGKGLEIETYSIRHPKNKHSLGENDKKEIASTWYVLPVSVMKLLVAHLTCFLKRPIKYINVLNIALHHRVAGFKNLLWSFFYFSEALLLSQQFEKRGVHHLHNHFSNASATVGLLVAEYLEISWSLTLHGSADYESDTRFLLKEKIMKAKFVCCVSYYGRAQAMRLSNVEDWPRIIIVRCGVDLKYFKFKIEPINNLLPRILCVARLSKEKGHSILINAFSHILKKGVKAELRLIGDGPERHHIEKLINSLGISQYCFLLGSKDEAEVKKELEMANVFVLSSLMEGVPVSIMEAMAIGVPVIAPRIAGIPEIINEGINGFLFTPTDDIELSERLTELVMERFDRSYITKNAYEKISLEYGIDSVCEPLLEQLNKIKI